MQWHAMCYLVITYLIQPAAWLMKNLLKQRR